MCEVTSLEKAEPGSIREIVKAGIALDRSTDSRATPWQYLQVHVLTIVEEIEK